MFGQAGQNVYSQQVLDLAPRANYRTEGIAQEHKGERTEEPNSETSSEHRQDWWKYRREISRWS
jgi:hypothetical protein